jgi:hypothetical protein
MSRSGGYTIGSQTHWRDIGSITASHAELTVTTRAVATAEALGSTYLVSVKPDGRPAALLFRFRTDGSNDGSSVLQLYSARGNDYYHKIAQLTILQGQQLQTGLIYFVDTITPANEDTLFDGEEVNLTDQIAHYFVRTFACDRFLFLASTLTPTTIYIDVAYLYE